jgi:hypothetical protein
MVDRIIAPVSRATYKMFAQAYGIRLCNKIKLHDKYMKPYNGYKQKTMKELRKDIYEFEETNNIANGLYF